MMKWLFVALLLLSLPIFALQTYNPVIEDTFIVENASCTGSGGGICSFDISGNVNLSSQLNYGNFNESAIYLIKFGGAATDIRSLWKFNNSPYQRKVIEGLKLSYSNAEFDCGGGAAFSAFWENDDSWNENTVTFASRPVLDTSQRLTGINDSAVTNQLVLINGNLGSNAVANSSELHLLSSFTQPNANLLDDLYSGGQTTIYTEKTGGTCGAVVGNKFTVYSKEKVGTSSINVSLNFNLVDYSTAFIQGTDTSTTYFDFETGFSSTSSFPQADFAYNALQNQLTPVQPASFAQTDENDNTNTLSTINCADHAPFSGSNINSLNIPTGSYDIICFDLINEHNGNQFYGAIKVINNTDIRGGGSPEFDFYYAIYSSELITFSPATLSPDPPQAENNLTFSWTTSRNLSTSLRFRFLEGGVFSAWATIENSTQTTSHQATIPDDLMFETFYEYQLFGTALDNITYSTDVSNFTAVGVFTTNQISFVGSRVYFDFETQTSSSSSFNGVDFDINSTNNTLTSYAPRSFITVEGNADNTLENVDCRLAPSYSSTTNMNVQENSVFCYDLSAQHGGDEFFGAIKITTISPTLIEFYWATYTPDFVTFFGIVKIPSQPEASRDLQIRWQTSIPLTSKLQYSFQRINETGYSSYRLIEDTSAFRKNHAITIPASDMFVGDYIFFLQGDDSSNNSYTSNTFNFTVVNQSTTGAISNPIALFLGITTEQALNMISLIIALVITIAVTIRTGSPIKGIMSCLISLVVFVAIGWLGLVFGIILMLLAIGVAVFLAQKILFGGG